MSIPGSSVRSRYLAILREVTYPRLPTPDRLTAHLSLLSRGEYIVLLIYMSFIMATMWTNVILESRSNLYSIKLEVVAFRAGWVSTVQLPLLYVTALKVSPISIMTGISYERINWMHRWVARITLLTLFFHAFFFTYEWALSQVFIQQLKHRPMVLWGFAAAGIMLLIVVGGWRYLRSRHYEVWIVGQVLGAYAALARPTLTRDALQTSS